MDFVKNGTGFQMLTFFECHWAILLNVCGRVCVRERCYLSLLSLVTCHEYPILVEYIKCGWLNYDFPKKWKPIKIRSHPLVYVLLHRFIFFPKDLTRKKFVYLKWDYMNWCQNHHGRIVLLRCLVASCWMSFEISSCGMSFEIRFPKKKVKHFTSFRIWLSWMIKSDSRNLPN